MEGCYGATYNSDAYSVSLLSAEPSPLSQALVSSSILNSLEIPGIMRLKRQKDVHLVGQTASKTIRWGTCKSQTDQPGVLANAIQSRTLVHCQANNLFARPAYAIESPYQSSWWLQRLWTNLAPSTPSPLYHSSGDVYCRHYVVGVFGNGLGVIFVPQIKALIYLQLTLTIACI